MNKYNNVGLPMKMSLVERATIAIMWEIKFQFSVNRSDKFSVSLSEA